MVAALTKNDPFWTNVVFLETPKCTYCILSKRSGNLHECVYACVWLMNGMVRSLVPFLAPQSFALFGKKTY